MPANMSELAGIETLSGLVIFANTAAEGVLFGGLMIAIFFVMLMILKKWEIEKALLASSFSCFILSMFLTYAKVLNLVFPLVFLIVMAFTLFYLFVTKR